MDVPYQYFLIMGLWVEDLDLPLLEKLIGCFRY